MVVAKLFWMRYINPLAWNGHFCNHKKQIRFHGLATKVLHKMQHFHLGWLLFMPLKTKSFPWSGHFSDQIKQTTCHGLVTIVTASKFWWTREKARTMRIRNHPNIDFWPFWNNFWLVSCFARSRVYVPALFVCQPDNSLQTQPNDFIFGISVN